MASENNISWMKSDEKEQLRNDIINGVVTDNMQAALVYQMHHGAYHKFKFERFKVNLRNLRLAITKSEDAAKEDQFALANYLEQLPAQVDLPPYPPWYGSVNRACLLADIEASTIEGVKSENVWQMRPEYSIYPLDVFRDHLNKEKKNPTTKGYWEHERDLKELKTKNKKRTK